MSSQRPPLRPGEPARGREPDVDAAGLCPRCIHVRRLVSAKGSVFWLCERSRAEPEFPRYPPQPRMVCRGFAS